MRNSLNVPDPLLVSCPNGGGMAMLDGDLCLRLSEADCTGMAVGHESVIWCLQEDGARSLREMRDGQLRTVALSPEPLDLHDVLLHGDDVFVAATQTNEVLQLDRKLGVRDRWMLGAEPDSSHLNCLVVREGRLLASIFGRFDGHRGYKGNSRGAGQIIDVRTGETVLEGFSQPHSLVVEGDLLYVCNSEEKEVVVYDAFERVRTIGLPGYTRGLAVGQEHIYVGLSCSRNMEIESQTGYFESGAVAILRKHDMRLIGTVQLPWKEVYDIRIVGDRDLLRSLLVACWERERVVVQADVHEKMLALEHQTDERIASMRTELQEVKTVAAKNYLSLEQSSAKKLQDVLRQVGEANDLLGRSDRRVKELEAQVSSLNDVLRKRNERLARVRISHAEVGALAIRRQLELDARDERIARLQGMVQERDARVVELQEVANGLNSRILDLQREIRERDELARTNAAAMERANERARSLEADLRSEMERVRAITGLIALRDGQVSELEVSLERALEYRKKAMDLTIRVATLEQAATELELLRHSRSWRLTRPLRFLARTLRNHGLVGSDRDRVRSWLQLAPSAAKVATREGNEPIRTLAVVAAPVVQPDPELREVAKVQRPSKAPPYWLLRKNSSEVALESQGAGLEDLYVWGVIDWHFRIQRPQHLARELSLTGRRVFYISNNFIDSPEPGFKVEPLDGEGRLFQVFLNVAGKPVIYFDPPDAQVQAKLEASIRALLMWTRSCSTVSLVQHPFWSRVSRTLPNHRLVYDCMDHHGGFENNASAILAVEKELMREADLLVVSSVWLDEEGAKFNGNRALIRNAGEYEHFASRPGTVFADPRGRRVIGYYGAIAQWFDIELVEQVAKDNPECLVLLVGADTCRARDRLAHCANVEFTGEVSYSELPFYLHGFDVCMLPFRVLPLTLATNPVKAYEYLSAGKPVVTVDLPEMRQFGDLVRRSSDPSGFMAHIRDAICEKKDDPMRTRRRELASAQTWSHRAVELVQAIARIPEPRVSIVVLAYNNLELTKACLESIERHTDYPNLEVIVVDNASTDGSREFLHRWADEKDDRILLLNEENKGFAAGNNRGLEAASGEYLVLLNNDTQVVPGWLRTMVAHLKRDATIGILGPVTNNIGNEAKIDISYKDAHGMLGAAADYTLRHAGVLMDIRTVAFFCVMLPRRAYERVGGLDERFGVGFFEDDDYCRRIEAVGLRVACAEDVFVHHHLSASFSKLADADRNELFERNKAIYEEKWGEWVPHRYRGKGIT